MKRIIFLLFAFSNCLNAQTSFNNSDIDAAAGNEFETLLTNVDPVYPDIAIQSFFQTSLAMYEESAKNTKLENFRTFRSKSNIGKEKPTEVNYKMFISPLSGYKRGISKRVEIWGDYEKVVSFFVKFWSKSISFKDVKHGEIVSTRFLTDIATLTFPQNGIAKITVITVKDR